jgi:capsular exopolysaccharide synthesis family protein
MRRGIRLFDWSEMSRINEALKRAGGAAARRDTGGTAEALLELAGDLTLNHYPAETSSQEGLVARITRGQLTGSGPKPGPVVELRSRTVLSLASNAMLVVGSDADSLVVEQYRRLGATLHEAQIEKSVKVVMVTSAAPGDGKTLTVVNLALTLSESYGRRVLLIDGDLRRPAVHAMLGLSNEAGLADMLRKGTEVSFQEVSETLSVLTAGSVRENTPAGLSSDRMSALLRKAVLSFDWVLLDSPPVALMSDAQILAQLVQGVLFVIRAGSTPYPLIEKALADLGRDRIIGTVLNGTTEAAIPETSYYETYSGR